MEHGPHEPVALENLATRADERAAHARQHAADARDQARADAARGDHHAETIHLGEARAHEGAAQVTEQTAALYRARLQRLQQSHAQEAGGPASPKLTATTSGVRR